MKFGIGLVSLISSIIINILIGDIDFYIINTNILFLLYLTNLDKKKTFFNNVKNILISVSKQLLII